MNYRHGDLALIGIIETQQNNCELAKAKSFGMDKIKFDEEF